MDRGTSMSSPTYNAQGSCDRILASSIGLGEVRPWVPLPKEKSLNGIIHIRKVTQLTPIPDLERFLFNEKPNPDPQKGLPGVLDSHPGPVGIRQAQCTAPNPIDIVVKEGVPPT